MKKLIAFVLIAVMVLSMAACGTVNKSEVSILWSGDGVVKVPNSLINSMERAMYIENISYVHYGANGDQAAQTKQAETVLNAGCAALVVELVDAAAAQEILDLAKAKDVPVIFFNCDVDPAVVSGYAKAACVISDVESVPSVQGEQIAEGLYKDQTGFIYKLFGKKPYVIDSKADRNEDGKITYIGIGDVAATVEAINASFKEKKLSALEAAIDGADVSVISSLTESTHINSKKKEVFLLNTTDGASVELIITDSDASAMDVLLALQGLGFNSNKLKTHCIPVYTVGNEVDYKEYVLQTMPASPISMDTEDKAEIKQLDNWWKGDEAVTAWKESCAVLCPMTSVNWADLGAYLYSTTDVIGAGRLAGTTLEDYDTISTTVASVLKALLTGNTVEEQVNKIPYTQLISQAK